MLTVSRLPPLNRALRALGTLAVSRMAGEALDRSRRSVPSPVPVLMVTILVAPEPVTSVAAGVPVMPPPGLATVKLPVATPVTGSLKVTVKVAVAEPVGVVTGTIERTVGGVVSTISPMTNSPTAPRDMPVTEVAVVVGVPERVTPFQVEPSHSRTMKFAAVAAASTLPAG